MFRRNFLCPSLCPLPLVLPLGTTEKSCYLCCSRKAERTWEELQADSSLSIFIQSCLTWHSVWSQFVPWWSGCYYLGFSSLLQIVFLIPSFVISIIKTTDSTYICRECLGIMIPALGLWINGVKPPRSFQSSGFLLNTASGSSAVQLCMSINSASALPFQRSIRSSEEISIRTVALLLMTTAWFRMFPAPLLTWLYNFVLWCLWKGTNNIQQEVPIK